MGNLKLVVLLSLLLCSHCKAQVFEVELLDEPIAINSFGEVVPESQDDNSSDIPIDKLLGARELVVTNEPQRPFREFDFDRYCPGLVTAFDGLRRRPGFKLQCPTEVKAVFNKIIDDAISKRHQLIDEFKSKGLEPVEIVTNQLFLQRLYDQERLADGQLSDILYEIAIPDELRKYISALGHEYEFQLVSSKLFHLYITETDAEFARRLKKSQAVCSWMFALPFTLKNGEAKNLTDRTSLFAGPFEDLTVDQFMKLKFLLGQAKHGEDAKSYLARTKKPGSSQYVTALQSLR